MAKNSQTLQIMVRVALLVALDVLLMNYLGIHTTYFKIGFSFVPIAVCGMLYGAGWATVCAGLGDLINCFLGPFGWYPPLTISACLNGFIFGLILKKRSDRLSAVVVAVVVAQIAISLLLNTYLLSLLYGTPYTQLMVTRIPQILIMLPVEIIVLRAMGSKKFLKAIGGSSLQPSEI